MSLGLKFDVRLEDLKRIEKLGPGARLAAAKALTFTAKDAQKAVQASAPSEFHLRNSWVVKGIRIEPATAGSLHAGVGSIDKYMERHVIGASSKPKKPAHALSIFGHNGQHGKISSGGLLIKPYGSIGEVPTHTVVRRQLNRSTKNKTFQIVGKGGTVLIVKRAGKKRLPLKILAALAPGAHIKQTWPFEQIVAATVGAKFGPHYIANLTRAVR